MRPYRIASSLVLLALAGCVSGSPGPAAPTDADAPHHFDGTGPHRRTITTGSKDAQAWFDQGLVFAYSFNHDEAVRSFTAAAEADPRAPMAWWGIALAHGPHINNPVVPPAREQAACDAVKQALALKAGASQVEAALIDALAKRYVSPPTPDRAARDAAYADAMRAVWKAYPKDADVGALCAEALMDLHPWDLWKHDGTAQPWTGEILGVLEAVQKLEPDHPGALHFYIHAVEAGPDPRRALAAANRLRVLVPASGHMLHMPSHIDVLLGQWQEAIDSNERAIESDLAYRKVRPHQDFHHVYMAHNNQMLAFAGMMDGRSQLAIESAREVAPGVPDDYARSQTATIEPYFAILYDALVRFGKWDEILAEPAPPDYLHVTNAFWRFARGAAFAAKGQVKEAEAEAGKLREIAAKIPPDRMLAINPAKNVLAIAGHVLDGEIAYRKGEVDKAVGQLKQAIALEDELVYMEPPEWPLPVRHTLGAILLDAGKIPEAEAAYREDLEQWPGNGWSLYGLAECAKRKGAAGDEAAKAAKAFNDAWADADVKITASCACITKK